MGERLGETGVGEVMTQARIGHFRVLFRPGGNFLGCLPERIKMAGGIAITPRVIGDDGLAAAEELDQFGVHGGGNQAAWLPCRQSVS